MQFAKMHGLGNDFVMINGFAETIKDYQTAAKKMCDRHFGIGSDGLILILPSDKADFRMRMFNPDGSEAEMCGNGIRCFAKFVYEKGLSRAKVIKVETLAGMQVLESIVENGKVTHVRVDMGEPRLRPEEIPVLKQGESVIAEKIAVEGEEYQITCVSMGNPHTVVFVEDAEAVPLEAIGPKIETHPAFPKKTNVEFIQVLNRNELKMRVWERGAGITLACGTGACASAVAAILNNLTERKVTVHLAGGDLVIEWGNDNHVYMTGPAVEVFTGEYLADF